MLKDNLTTEQLLSLLIQSRITRTQFKVILIPAITNTRLSGKPIGQGSCRGVRLYLNSLVLDSAGDDSDPPVPLKTGAAFNQIYYGDEAGQYHELIAGVESKFIPCRDLQEIWIRGNGSANQVIVTIYLGNDDDEIYQQGLDI